MNKEFLLSSNYQMKSKVLDLLLAPHTHNRVKPVSRINPVSIRTRLASVKIVRASNSGGSRFGRSEVMST